MKQHQGMVARTKLVWMMFVVRLPAALEQHFPPNRVIASPFSVVLRRPQHVFRRLHGFPISRTTGAGARDWRRCADRGWSHIST
jgi:hypothetical protein